VTFAYVDSSCPVALAFDERGARKPAARLRRLDRLFSSSPLEAELRPALAREGVHAEIEALLSWLTWVYPNRPSHPNTSVSPPRGISAAPISGIWPTPRSWRPTRGV